MSSSAIVTAIGPSSPAPGSRASRPSAVPQPAIRTTMATLRYQGAEPLSVASTVGWVRSGAKTRVTTIGIDRGDQPHPQVLHHCDDAIVPAEFAGDGDQTGGAAGDERQRPGQRADVAVQAHQRTGGHAEHERAHGDAGTMGQCEPSAPSESRCTMVPM